MSSATKAVPTTERSPLRLALAERVYRISAMLRFEAQAVAEVQYIRRANLRPDDDVVRSDELSRKVRDTESTLRSLAAAVLKLGLEIESVDPGGRAPAQGESATRVLDTYLARAASAASGGEEAFP
jgi:hypothetical protein